MYTVEQSMFKLSFKSSLLREKLRVDASGQNKQRHQLKVAIIIISFCLHSNRSIFSLLIIFHAKCVCIDKQSIAREEVALNGAVL